MFAKSKISQSMIDAVNKVLGEQPVEQKDELLNETAPIKEPTPTGMRVYGGSYGNSAKAKKDQTKSPVDNLKGPKDKEMKEELKGNQDKIDANHNDKIDAQDFKILKAKKKVKEGREFTEKLLETVRKSDVPAYLRKAKGDTPLTMADAKGPKKDTISAPENLAKARNEEVELEESGPEIGDDPKKAKKNYLTKYKDHQASQIQPKIGDDPKKAKKDYVAKYGKANEEVEHLDEGVMDKMSLSALWHKHGQHHYVFDQGHGHGYGSSHHNDQAMTAIENHVRKQHGNKVADDMVHHSELRTAADEYLGGKDARNAESTATKLRAKHKIQGDMHGNLDEEVEHLNEDETLKAIAKKHDMKYHPGTYGANMSHPTKGYVNVNRYGEWGHYKQGRFDRGHGPATAHGDSSQHFSDLDKHLATLKEEADITTDTLAGRSDGGKDNSFKKFKVKLKGDGIERPMADKPESTPSRASIKSEEVEFDEVLDEAVSRKDFQMVADLIKTHDHPGKRKELAQHHAEIFSKQNPRFDHAKFMKAAGVNEATIAGSSGWEPMKKDVKDKSGAVHTPMSRAKDLARQAFKTVSDKTKVKEPK